MTGEVSICPGTEQIRLRMDDGYEKVLSIEQALALRSALTKAVYRARRPQTPHDRILFDRMDEVWVYISMSENQSMKCIEILGRRNGVYVSVALDILGASSLFFSDTRPNMATFKPYILCRDLDSAMPYLMAYRGIYRDRFLSDCGLSYDDLSGERFLEAAETPDGGLIFVTESKTRDGRMSQTAHFIDVWHGHGSRKTFYSDDANYPYHLRSDLRRIPKDEAVALASDAATSWYDVLIEIVRPWFDDGSEEAKA